MPSYEILLNTFKFATSKKYFLVHTFLDEYSLIQIDKSVTEKYSNFNLMEKQLVAFDSGNYKHKLIHKYYQHLCAKLQHQQITLRSIRLSLTPAIKFLKYCENFQDDKPSMNALEGYLWLYLGQRATITEFTNFLTNKCGYNLHITRIAKAKLKRPNVSHQILKARVIKLMQNPQLIDKNTHYFYAAIFGYFHWVNIPQNVFIGYENCHKDKDGNYLIQIYGKKFYFPKKVIILTF